MINKKDNEVWNNYNYIEQSSFIMSGIDSPGIEKDSKGDFNHGETLYKEAHDTSGKVHSTTVRNVSPPLTSTTR